ncbi:hypothetical protein CRG98_026869 [Punica granatum]|uniref:RBR-type E3 ubiquitin transferase n=1 Tax=Punica granatum TaxID=22663 RepID=A0A2I0J945_PUNGR|nr:hypothetical protein CRG98_026869 [Punica granatum]
MATYIKVEVEQGTAYVMCPMPSCDWILDPISCKGLVTREVFNRWCDRLCECDILGFERCYCPNRDCQELIVNECGPLRREEIKCPSCGKSCCFQCASPWDETDDHRCDDDVHIFVESKNWKQCPGCKNYVERHKGCNIIFCRCQTQFCYYCGATKESIFVRAARASKAHSGGFS